MANFYAMDSSFFLTCHHSEKCENLIIKNNTSQLLFHSISYLASHLLLGCISHLSHDAHIDTLKLHCILLSCL